MSHEVTVKLLVIITCFAVLTFAGSRRWLRSIETIIIGLAMIFWATGWLLESLVHLSVSLYGASLRAALVAIGLTFPVTLAMSVGLWFLVRRMRKNAGGASSPSSPSPRIRKKNKQ